MLREKITILRVAAVIILASVLAACGGGGGGTNTQQPGGQSQPVADPPNMTTVIAIFNDQTMSFSMGSGVGAVLPNATVVIEDPQSFVASTTATADGAFEFLQADVPPNFMTAPGTQIGVMQFTADTARSNPAYVTITLPDGSVP